MQLSNTAGRDSFTLHRPGNSVVTFEFASAGSSNTDGRTTIRVPPRSTWSPGPHWHERYTEYIKVHQGIVGLVINGEPALVTPEDGIQTIPRFAVHEWMRADIRAAEDKKDGTEVTVEEWTEPRDGAKEVFFRMLFSTLEDSQRFGRWTALQILLISATYDNFDIIARGPLSWLLPHVALASVRVIGWLTGLRPWYEEYLPQKLWPVAARGGEGSVLEKRE